jgi:hypothetical protein
MTTIRTENPFLNHPTPAGAIRVDDWTDLGTEWAHRYFEGPRRGTSRHRDSGDVQVFVAGHQHRDGSVSREIVVGLPRNDDAVTGAQARELAAMLIEAADEIDRWAAAADTPTPSPNPAASPVGPSPANWVAGRLVRSKRRGCEFESHARHIETGVAVRLKWA